MDLEILAKVLGMSNCPPILRPAKVMRYDIKLWGPLPALQMLISEENNK